MRITFITIFPEVFNSFLNHSIIKRAIDKKIITVDLVNPRDFTTDRRVDDYIYGGGQGMLMMIEPVISALNSVKTKQSRIIFLSPRGKRLEQSLVKKYLHQKHLIFIAGHYEGIDARIKYYIDEELSIGDFIVTGGEYPAMIVADSIIRLLPNVIKEASHQNESFENNLLEYDQYTRPEKFENHQVPKILLSGNHKKIAEWKENNALKITNESK